MQSIETCRLALVPVSMQHASDILRHFTACIAAYMLPSPPQNLDETRQIVNRFIQQRLAHTDYSYAVTLKADGSFLGIASLEHCQSARPELGIWLQAAAHGRHYGREAIGALLSYAAILGLATVYYPVDTRNIASKKIPLFYGAALSEPARPVLTQDGRTLLLECYAISVATALGQSPQPLR